MTASASGEMRLGTRLEGTRVHLGRFASHVRRPAVAIPLAILGLLVGLAVFGPLLWPKGPLAVDLGSTLQAPSFAHPMGTDELGRDVFARFLEGARISLGIGALVVVVGAAIGGAIGIVGGTFGGWVDGVSMRTMDALLAFPPLVLAMAVTVGLGVGLRSAALGIMLTSVPWYARVLRSEVLRVRATPFVEAIGVLGATRRRLMRRHILPHVLPTLLIQAAAVFGYAVLALAALSFVGLGAQLPTPEWGAMITEGLPYALSGQWWISIFPGIGILLLVVSSGLLADRARDILDPQARHSILPE